MSTSQRIRHSLFSTGALLLLGAFAVWWFQLEHVPNNFHGWWHKLDFVLFIVVSYILWHPFVMEVLSWAIVSHIKEPVYKAPPEGYKVAFVTTFVPQSESIELLERTLPAMVAADYPHDTWVLDEGNDPRVRALCARLGVYHYSRKDIPFYNTEEGKFARKTKGGNHNSWYDAYGNNYHFVAQMDTDFVPHKSFLFRTLGYFNDPSVAFVGTPQIYGNIHESLIARGAAEQTYNFYGPILRGLFGMNTTLLIGANHVIRVAALKQVNHYSAHITEDLLTGMKLHAHGWKSVYVHQPLAVGEGPTSWEAYFNQQMRWAYGCIDILFRHTPKLLKHMNWRRRIYYFIIQQHYFSGLATMLSVVGLGLYAFFGITAARVQVDLFFELYLPAVFIVGMMSLWMQKFLVRPRVESGFHLAGKIVSLAAWPIFFMALLGALRGKRLVYKVTPKGGKDQQAGAAMSFSIFRAHLAISSACILFIISALGLHHRSAIMIGWMALTALLMGMLPFVLSIGPGMRRTKRVGKRYVNTLNDRMLVAEIQAQRNDWLPRPVSDTEKYSYVDRRHGSYMLFSVLSILAIVVGMWGSLRNQMILWPVWLFFFVSVIYTIVSILVSVRTSSFNLPAHQRLIDAWQPQEYPSVDVFLPIAGESLRVLRHTWEGIDEMRNTYFGPLEVYVLDDGNDRNAADLARSFNFHYVVRPNRGEFKKAGNLQHGLQLSQGKFIALFDADFRPRADFLQELLPYFYKDEPIGIVQSPQYFDVSTGQNWLQRGAGAVQELFFRYTQTTRQNYGAAICVGSNAIYNRQALQLSGGFAQIEHSEDVHTGFQLQQNGWKLQYVPLVLAKGLCPESLTTFFKQQYRWCLGTLSLIGAKHFRWARLPWRNRLSYYAGLLYYIHTAVSALFIPILSLVTLWYYADVLTWSNYLYALPSFLLTQIFYPMWHDSLYGIEAWSVRMIAGWSHVFAIIDSLRGRTAQWLPSGTKAGRDNSYRMFRLCQLLFNFIPALAWVGLSVERMFTGDRPLVILPLLLSGTYYLLMTIKITFYRLPDFQGKRSRASEMVRYLVNATS